MCLEHIVMMYQTNWIILIKEHGFGEGDIRMEMMEMKKKYLDYDLQSVLVRNWW